MNLGPEEPFGISIQLLRIKSIMDKYAFFSFFLSWYTRKARSYLSFLVRSKIHDAIRME